MSGPSAGKPLGGGYDVARPQGKCSLCQREIAPGEKFIAAVREIPIGMERIDACGMCKANLDRTTMLASWQTVMPTANEKKKLFVDDEVLKELFIRLGETTETTRIHFRFVLGLILMRKRLVIYESTFEPSAKNGTGDGQKEEIWQVRVRGQEGLLEMVNPHLTEEQVVQVSQQLGDILNEEL